MFDIGFSELVLTALIALIVLGPERLPKVARTVGHLLGRMQRYAASVKADIEREIQLEELKKLEAQIQAQARAFESEMQQQVAQVQHNRNEAQRALETEPPPSNSATGSDAGTSAEKTTAPAAESASAPVPTQPESLLPPELRDLQPAKSFLNNGLKQP